MDMTRTQPFPQRGKSFNKGGQRRRREKKNIAENDLNARNYPGALPKSVRQDFPTPGPEPVPWLPSPRHTSRGEYATWNGKRKEQFRPRKNTYRPRSMPRRPSSRPIGRHEAIRFTAAALKEDEVKRVKQQQEEQSSTLRQHDAGTKLAAFGALQATENSKKTGKMASTPPQARQVPSEPDGRPSSLPSLPGIQLGPISDHFEGKEVRKSALVPKAEGSLRLKRSREEDNDGIRWSTISKDCTQGARARETELLKDFWKQFGSKGNLRA